MALNRAGDYERARAVLTAVADRIREYAGNDPELLAIIDELEREMPEFAMPMAEPARKAKTFAAYKLSHSRDFQGRAQKSQG